MENLENALRTALSALGEATSKNAAKKQMAVRWFNRLYYDLSCWVAEVTAFLETYPGFKVDAVEQEFESFNQRFIQFAEQFGFDQFRRRFGWESDICLRLEFLSGRLTRDFRWLKEEDPEAYEKLENSVGTVRRSRIGVYQLAMDLYESLQELEDEVLGRYDWRSQTRDTPTIDRAKQIIENYVQEANTLLDKIGQEARAVGFTLLSVTEYEVALQREGSANPDLYVIGEVSMSNSGDTYNVNQAGAVGKNARSDNNKFFQSQETKNLAEAANEIQQLLKQLEQNNPTATESEKISYVNDETTPGLKRRTVSALQAGGEAAIEEFLDNPYINVGKAIVKGWIKPE